MAISGFVETQAFQMLLILLPSFSQEKLEKLAKEEGAILRKLCSSYSYYHIAVGDMINVVYFATKEAIERFKPEYNVPLEGYIKYLTLLRAKDELRRLARGMETKWFIRNTSIKNTNYTTYDYTANIEACKEKANEDMRKAVMMMLIQYCERAYDTKIGKCIMMIYEQYGGLEIQKILKISRRKYEKIRNDFYEYARNYWNYDNIY